MNSEQTPTGQTRPNKTLVAAAPIGFARTYCPFHPGFASCSRRTAFRTR